MVRIFDKLSNNCGHIEPGGFLPFSRGRISAPFPIENSHLFINTISVFCFFQLRKVKKNVFF